MDDVSRELLHSASGQEKALLEEEKKAFIPGLPDFPLEGLFHGHQRQQKFLVQVQELVSERAPKAYREELLRRFPKKLPEGFGEQWLEGFLRIPLRQHRKKFRKQALVLFMIHWLEGSPFQPKCPTSPLLAGLFQ